MCTEGGDSTYCYGRCSTVHKQEIEQKLNKNGSGKVVSAKSEGTFEFQMSAETGPVRLDRVFHVLILSDSLILFLVSATLDTLFSSLRTFVSSRWKNVVGVGRRM